MNEAHILKIAGELKIQPRQVLSTARLFAEGATVPFIARYRKEATGSLDEVAVTNIRERLLGLADLDSRRETILKSLAERNLLSDELKAAVNKAESVTQLEDIYLPYRPKRRTRATIAREQGLEPLADLLFGQQSTADPLAEAARFVSTEKGVADVAAALAGARDIIAERVNDMPPPAQNCAICSGARALLNPRSCRTRSRRRPSSRIISTGANRSPKFRAIACWPSAAVKPRVF